MKHQYDDYYFCGGIVEERLLPREIQWYEHLKRY